MDARKEAVLLLKLAYAEIGVNCVLHDYNLEAVGKLTASIDTKKINADVLQQEGAPLEFKAPH